jgi:hypothetical protein
MPADRRAASCGHQGTCGEVLAVEIKKIEEEKHESGGAAGVGGQLDHAERGDAVGAHAAEFAVEIGLARGQCRNRRGDLGIFGGPVKPVAGGSRTSPRSSRACTR